MCCENFFLLSRFCFLGVVSVRVPDLSNGDVMYTPVKLSFFSSFHPPSLINQPSMLNKSSSAPVSIGLSAPPPALPRFPSTRRPRHRRVRLRAAGRYHGERQGCKGREAMAEYGEAREHFFRPLPPPAPFPTSGATVSVGAGPNHSNPPVPGLPTLPKARLGLMLGGGGSAWMWEYPAARPWGRL